MMKLKVLSTAYEVLQHLATVNLSNLISTPPLQILYLSYLVVLPKQRIQLFYVSTVPCPSSLAHFVIWLISTYLQNALEAR